MSSIVEQYVHNAASLVWNVLGICIAWEQCAVSILVITRTSLLLLLLRCCLDIIIIGTRAHNLLSWHLQCTVEGDLDARLTVSGVHRYY